MITIALLGAFFRPTWADYDKDRINTRHEVLMYSSVITPTLDCNRNRCMVKSGLWVCPYTGSILNDPSEVDIDHVVPLKNAYESGAKNWDKSRWRAFANDEDNLLAVLASENRSKSDSGPDKWPHRDRWESEEYWCKVYLPLFLSIKQKWGLELINQEANVASERCAESFPAMR